MKHSFSFNILECEGPLQPEVVQSTALISFFPASSVLILGKQDGLLGNDSFNFWLAESQKTTGQGFTLKVDNCARLIAGCQIRNKGKGMNFNWATKGFRVSGGLNESGPWNTLLEDELIDTRGKAASLLNFTFEEPVEIKFLRFDLVSYWGTVGAGLQYFAPIASKTTKAEVTSK